jgi:hypothetical protein
MNKKQCLICKELFSKPQNYSDKQWSLRQFCSKKCGATKLSYDANEIALMYIRDKKSSSEIGEKLNMSAMHVRRILKSLNIDIRPASEYQKLSHSRPDVRQKMALAKKGTNLSENAKQKLRERTGPKNPNWNGGLTVLANGYIYFTASPENGVHANRALHCVIAEWAFGGPIPKGFHVHHIDGNKLNNNPENLAVMSASEHAKLHTGDRENGKRSKSM